VGAQNRQEVIEHRVAGVHQVHTQPRMPDEHGWLFWTPPTSGATSVLIRD
jgi:hypothetical protein